MEEYIKPITEEMIKDAIEDGWDEIDARRGYGIFVNEFGNGAEHIERIDEMNVFESDEEAANQAEKDGIKIIRDMSFKGTEYQYYIDTPENRALLKEIEYISELSEVQEPKGIETEVINCIRRYAEDLYIKQNQSATPGEVQRYGESFVARASIENADLIIAELKDELAKLDRTQLSEGKEIEQEKSIE